MNYRNSTFAFSVGILLVTQSAIGSSPFNKNLEYEGIRFVVTCPNEGSLNTVTISPQGLRGENKPITREIDGSVTGAEVADLNSDGFPEVYVFTTSMGSGSYGDVVGYVANRKEFMTEIYLPPLEENKVATKGYMGHDHFEIIKVRLVRQFPVYLPKDANARPTSGKLRQILYRLVAGKAGWILKPYKTFDIKISG